MQRALRDNRRLNMKTVEQINKNIEGLKQAADVFKQIQGED